MDKKDISEEVNAIVSKMSDIINSAIVKKISEESEESEESEDEQNENENEKKDG